MGSFDHSIHQDSFRRSCHCYISCQRIQHAICRVYEPFYKATAIADVMQEGGWGGGFHNLICGGVKRCHTVIATNTCAVKWRHTAQWQGLLSCVCLRGDWRGTTGFLFSIRT